MSTIIEKPEHPNTNDNDIMTYCLYYFCVLLYMHCTDNKERELCPRYNRRFYLLQWAQQQAAAEKYILYSDRCLMRYILGIRVSASRPFFFLSCVPALTHHYYYQYYTRYQVYTCRNCVRNSQEKGQMTPHFCGHSLGKFLQNISGTRHKFSCVILKLTTKNTINRQTKTIHKYLRVWTL